MILYDPPSGWRYGFPRPYNPRNLCPRVEARVFCNECGYPRSEAMYTEDEDQEGVPHIKLWESVAQTLVRDGYPKDQAHFAAKHCRFIGHRTELEKLELDDPE